MSAPPQSSFVETFPEPLLIDPDRFDAELHRQGPDGRWTCARFTEPDHLISLESTGITLRLRALSEKVELPS